ncbi:MAG: hypothetical protein WCK67_11785 [bacterium]
MLTINSQVMRTSLNTVKQSCNKENKTQSAPSNDKHQNSSIAAYSKNYYVGFNGLFDRKPHLNHNNLIKHLDEKLTPDEMRVINRAEVKHTLDKLCQHPDNLIAKTDGFYYMKDNTIDLFTKKPDENTMLSQGVTDFVSALTGPKVNLVETIKATQEYFKNFSSENPDTEEGIRAGKIQELLKVKHEGLTSWDPPEIVAQKKAKANEIKLLRSLSNDDKQHLTELADKLDEKIAGKTDKTEALYLVSKHFENKAKNNTENEKVAARSLFASKLFTEKAKQAEEELAWGDDEEGESAIDICSKELKTDLKANKNED